MIQTKANLQDSMLNQIRKEHVLSTVHLQNGVPLKGYIKAFDSFVILLDCEGKQMMVYKHAVSTVTPIRTVFPGQNENHAIVHVEKNNEE